MASRILARGIVTLGLLIPVAASMLRPAAHAEERVARLTRVALREPRYRTLPEYEKVEKGESFYADIINHSRDKFKDYGDRSTTAHETTHGIHSYLRTKYSRLLGRRVNGFYLGADRTLILDEPSVKKSDMVPFVPTDLRGDRYKLYVAEQKDWDDTPLYIFDEWVAYVNGSLVALEELDRKKPEFERSNELFACVEFAVYATALGMAVEKHDPRYFARDEQFRAFLAWHLKRSLEVYRKGAARPQYAWKPEYYGLFKKSDEAREMRAFLRDKLDLDLGELFQ